MYRDKYIFWIKLYKNFMITSKLIEYHDVLENKIVIVV